MRQEDYRSSRPDKLHDSATQRLRQTPDVVYRNVALTALYRADVGPVQATRLGQTLLGEPVFPADLAQVLRELLACFVQVIQNQT